MLYPLLASVSGRPWTQAELFGMAPDAKAVATNGALLRAKGHIATLLALPLLWRAINALTLRSMDAPEAAAPASAEVLGAATVIWRWRRAR